MLAHTKFNIQIISIVKSNSSTRKIVREAITTVGMLLLGELVGTELEFAEGDNGADDCPDCALKEN